MLPYTSGVGPALSHILQLVPFWLSVLVCVSKVRWKSSLVASCSCHTAEVAQGPSLFLGCQDHPSTPGSTACSHLALFMVDSVLGHTSLAGLSWTLLMVFKCVYRRDGLNPGVEFPLSLAIASKGESLPQPLQGLLHSLHCPPCCQQCAQICASPAQCVGREITQ